MKTKTTDLIADESIQPKEGRDAKGRFNSRNAFGGPKENSGRKPMGEPRKKAMESFQRGLPEAVAYLVECLRSDRDKDRKWAAELMIKKGIPNIEALMIHGEVKQQDNPLLWPPMPTHLEAQLKEIGDRIVDEELRINENQSH